jgi:hypothetical protein
MARKSVCVDFDGVIHSYNSGWKAAHIIPDGPVPGALEWLEEAAKHFTVNIFSARSNQPGGIDAMKRWLRQHATNHFDFDPVQVNRFMAALRFPTEKPPSVLYIDDRGFCFRGTFPSIEDVNSFRPWNK